MLQWDEVHPYSAVHVVQMGGALDATRLRSSINRTLQKHGLTRLTLDSGKCAFQYESGTADCEIRTVSGVEARSALVAEMERQLNLRFDHTRPFCPFRFLVAPEGASFFLGLVYLHPAADAESVVCLLKDIVTCYLEEGAGQGRGSLELYPDSRAYALWRHPMVVARRFLALPAQVRNLRSSQPRASLADADNLANGFVLFSVAPEDLRSLGAAAKTWGVTVNDLFIALLLKSLSPCAAGRAQERKRQKISIGCIVNLRKDLGVDGRRTFGLLLGSFTVTHEVPEGISLCNLVADIRDQTAPIKRHKLYLGTSRIGLRALHADTLLAGAAEEFHAKHYALGWHYEHEPESPLGT
jgi:NRPS condensation-like uncharacterized protein